MIYAVMFFRRPVEVAGGQGNPLFDLIFENVSVYAQVGLSLFVGWSLVNSIWQASAFLRNGTATGC